MLDAVIQFLESSYIDSEASPTMTSRKKENVSLQGLVERIENTLVKIQDDLYTKALNFRDAHITEVENFEEFKKHIVKKGKN